MNEELDGTRRAVGGQPGVGIGVGEEQLYQDGFKKGEFVFRLGTRTSVLRDRPGWVIADGTQTVDLIIDNVNYGKPNLMKRLLMGVDEATVGFAPGDTGGTDVHDHGFTQPNNHVVTQPSAHVITQPVFAAPTAHTITQPVVSNHGNHKHELPYSSDNIGGGNLYIATSGVFGFGAATSIAVQSTIAKVAAGPFNITPHLSNNENATLTHALGTNVGLSNNHDAPSRTTDVALTNNHAGTAVDAHAGGDVQPAAGDNKYPPYLAAWPLLKVYD